MAWVKFDPQFIGEVAFWLFDRIPACLHRLELTQTQLGLLCFAARNGGKRMEELEVVLAVHRDHRGPSLARSDARGGGVRKRWQAGGSLGFA